MRRLLFLILLIFVCSDGLALDNILCQDTTNSLLQTSNICFKWSYDKTIPEVRKVITGGEEGSKVWNSIFEEKGQEEIYTQLPYLQGVLGRKNIIYSGNYISQTSVNLMVLGDIVSINYLINSNLGLKQIFTKSGYPYYFNMSVILSNNGVESFSAFPNDSLLLFLGPVLCQKKSGQLELPSSEYYNVEQVASLNGHVYRQIIDTLKLGLLPIKSEELDWIGLNTRYFALLILPNNSNDAINTLPFSKTYINFVAISEENKHPTPNLPLLKFQLPVLFLGPGENIQWDFTIFSGPKLYNALKTGPKNLTPLLFSDLRRWMRWLCLAIYYTLITIHNFIPNWGWSIIMLAFVVRIILFPLGKKAQKSQNRFIEAQKKMLPELNEIKKIYKGGEQSEQILQLYKKNNFSPFAGLKPLLVVLIQLPILIALYHVLGSAYELCNARFLWINSLAEPDKLFSFGFHIPLLGSYFNILPFLMAFITFLSFKLAPAPTAEKKEQTLQNIFLVLITLLFFFLFYSFPAGMILYWTFANFFQVVQQKLMFKKLKV